MDGLQRAGAERVGDLDKRNFLTGNIVDTAMRQWLDQDHPEPGQLVPLADAKFEEWTTNGDVIKWKGSESSDKARVLRDAREALTRLEPWLMENVLPQAYQPEARGWATVHVPGIDGKLTEVELFYAIDILVKRLSDEMFVIYDLKTTRNENYVRGKTLAQLPYYALVVSAAFGIPLSQIAKVAFLTPLCSQMETALAPTEDDYRVLLQRITSYVHGIQAMDWTMRPTKDSVCRYRCDVAPSCPRGKAPEVSSSGRVDFQQTADLWKG